MRTFLLIFQKIAKEFYRVPEIDLFASCFSTQLPKYAPWSPSPSAFVISILRNNLKFYAFPLFNLIVVGISKLRNEETSGIIPYWVTQVWFPVMVALLQDFPILLLQVILTLPSSRCLQTRRASSRNYKHQRFVEIINQNEIRISPPQTD